MCQIIIEERWRQNSLYHSCFHLSAFRFFLLKMNFCSSVLHIVVVYSSNEQCLLVWVCVVMVDGIQSLLVWACVVEYGWKTGSVGMGMSCGG